MLGHIVHQIFWVVIIITAVKVMVGVHLIFLEDITTTVLYLINKPLKTKKTPLPQGRFFLNKIQLQTLIKQEQ